MRKGRGKNGCVKWDFAIGMGIDSNCCLAVSGLMDPPNMHKNNILFSMRLKHLGNAGKNYYSGFHVGSTSCSLPVAEIKGLKAVDTIGNC